MKKKIFTKIISALAAVSVALCLGLSVLAVDAPPDGGQPGGGGSSSGVDSYTAVTEYSSDATVSYENFSSTGTDENAILVSGGNVILDSVSVDRTSSDSTGGDNSSFYGVGAAVLATKGTAYISDSEITTDSAGGAGAFAYDTGVIYIADTTIHTQQNTSGGIHAAGGGTVYAYNLDVTTEGGSAAAIRSDRGGGTMVIDGGTYVSNGSGSPAIYCTADIDVNNSTLTATGSEAVCIEGLNSLYIYDSDLSGAMPDDSQNEVSWTVIVYQSMSGDSEVGKGTFQMSGGSVSTTNGGLFYTTNTESSFVLKNVEITTQDTDFFLRVTGNTNARGWGSSGSNGAQCTFTAIEQDMYDDIQWDSISTLDLYMTEASTLKGAFVNDESCAGSGGSGYANLYISSDSVWTVTGNSTLTNLYNAGTITDENGNTVTVKGTDGTVYVEGSSSYTITVSSYSESADTTGADAYTEWTAFEVERPAELDGASSDNSSESSSSPSSSESASSESASSSSESASGSSSESNGNYLPLIIIGIAVIAIIVIMLVITLINKKKSYKD